MINGKSCYQYELDRAQNLALQVEAGQRLSGPEEQFCRINRGQEPCDDLMLTCRYCLYRNQAIGYRLEPYVNIREALAWEREAEKCYAQISAKNKW